MARVVNNMRDDEERKRRLAQQLDALGYMRPAVIDDSRVRQAIVRTPEPGFERPVNPVPRTQPTPPPTKINQPAKNQPDFTQPPAWWMQPPSWWNKSQPPPPPAPMPAPPPAPKPAPPTTPQPKQPTPIKRPVPPSTMQPAPQPIKPTPPSQGRPVRPPITRPVQPPTIGIGGRPVPPRAGIPLPPVAGKKPIRRLDKETEKLTGIRYRAY